MSVNPSDKKNVDLLLLGTLGDLALRKLLPALYQLEKSQLLHSEMQIIGCARDNLTTEDYRGFVKTKIQCYLQGAIDEEVWKRLFNKLHFLQIDFTQLDDYQRLKPFVNNERIAVSYFATPPSLFAQLCQGLSLAGLSNPESRIIIEKPIGHDLNSSIVINDLVSKYFSETQIYRIDHYLGKETVLNLLVLRFANSFFSSNWDYTVIEQVQISVAEEVGVEGRWSYYDDAGQLRDMVQNHLLQILSLIAMEPPVSLDADSIRDEKRKVLKALRPITVENVNKKTVRGQYVPGFLNGKKVPGYLNEQGSNRHSKTETYVAIQVDIDNWRWAGVPFYLRTGKRMPKKQSEVVIYFKPQPHNLFYRYAPQLTSNKLIIRLQPDEGVEIQIMNKIPGLDETMQLQNSKLDLSFDKIFTSQRIADAYERLLLEAILGNQSLFVRRDEVEQAWKWIDSILDAWTKNDEPLHDYTAGSWGPTAANHLLNCNHHEWGI